MVTSGLSNAGIPDDAISTSICEIGRHRELAGIDGMKTAGRSDSDFKAAMQLAGGIVDVGLAPCDDDAAFYGDVFEVAGIEVAKGRNELRHSFQGSVEKMRA